MHLKRKHCLFIFLLFSFGSSAQSFDFRLLDKINTPVNEKIDLRWRFISNMNAPVCFAAPLSMLVTGAINEDSELLKKSYKVGGAILLAEGFTLAMKATFKRERPYNKYPDIIIRKARGDGFSFPSGHTSTAFATATSLSLSFPKWYVIAPSYAFACGVAYSRMYLGVHYPTDLLGGIVVGVGTSFLVFGVAEWLED